MKKSIFNLKLLHILIIIAIAFILRIWRFRTGEVFISNDEAFVSLAAFDLTRIFTNTSLYTTLIHTLRLLSFGWGYLHILSIFTMIMAISIIGITITEFWLMLPSVIIGVISCVIIYELTNELYNDKKAALISGLLLAIMPVSISLSRSIVNANVTSLLLMISILLLLRFIRTQRYTHLLPIFIGLYFGSDSQFLGIIFIMGAIFLWCASNKKAELRRLLSKISSKFFLILFLTVLPSVLPFLYFLAEGRISGGIIGHMITKEKILGFHEEIFFSYIYSVGIALAIVFLFSLIYLFWMTIKKKKECVLFIWFLSYSLPWFLLVSPTSLSRGYLIHSIIPLIIISSKNLANYIQNTNKKYIPVTIILLIALVTINATFQQVYNSSLFNIPLQDNEMVPGVLYFYGSVQLQNPGIKTAGYWIRHNTPENTTVLSELGPWLTKYYLHRTPFSDPETTFNLVNVTKDTRYPFVNYAVLNQSKNKPDLVIITPETYNKTRGYLKGFNKTVEITENKVARLLIYSKGKTTVKLLDTTTYDSLFDEKYGNIQNLSMNCYFCD